jgi:dipeptidyl aminopeptidase/acylaminoacyl peptidase
MPAMPRQEAFEAELEGAAVQGALDLPDPGGDGRPPIVLLCTGLPALPPDAASFLGDTTRALVDAGVAVASFSSDSGGLRRLVDTTQDAAAALQAVSNRPEIDPTRLGLLGWSLGALTACCLCGRTDRIARLCLICPVPIDPTSGRQVAAAAADLVAHLGGGEVPAEVLDGAAALAPARELLRHDRPTLIIHGAADRIVAPDASRRYADVLADASRPGELLLVALADHCFSAAAARAACLEHVSRFFTAAPRP